MSKMSLDSQTAVYRQQIEASEPTLNIQTWEINREGLVNNAVIVNETHVFRFPKHDWAIDHLWQEAKIGRSVTVRTQEDWLKMYETVQEKLFPHLMAFQKEWVHQHFAPVIESPAFIACEQTFINGDLGPYHLLYNSETRRLNGIIDFGTAGMGDPANDFCCLLNEYGESFLHRMSRYYPNMASLIERTRFWAGALELQWLLGGLRYPDDPSWFMVHIGRARDSRPIGSGWHEF